MRIAYLTQMCPSPINPDFALPETMTEALAKRGHRVLVIAASDREYSYHIYQNGITLIQLRSIKCPLHFGDQLLFLPFLKILQSLHTFGPEIIYMDPVDSINWVGYVYAFFNKIPAKSTPQMRIKGV